MSAGYPQFSPGTGYFSPGQRVSMDPEDYKITLTRRFDGSFEWSPEEGSVALINALNFNYPEGSTIDQKKQKAILKKLNEEMMENSLLNSNSPGMQVATQQRPSFSSASGTTLYTVNNNPSPSHSDPLPRTTTPPTSVKKEEKLTQSAGAGRKPKIEAYKHVFPSTQGGSMTKGRKGPLGEKSKADAKRNRKAGAVCAYHRKQRTKCDPEKCKDNALHVSNIQAQPVKVEHSRTPSNVSQPSYGVPSTGGPSPGFGGPRTPAQSSIYPGASPPPFGQLGPNTYGQFSPGFPFSNASPPMTLSYPYTGFMPPPQIRSSASSIAEPYGGYGAKFSPEIPMSSATNPTGQVFATAPLENLSQDPAIFPNNGASYQTFGLSPRQESYHSHGSANEYFNHDIIYNNEYNFHNETIFTNVNEEIPDDLFGPEVMRSMEDIHEQFGHGESFRSVEVKKRSTKRWWLSEKLRKFVRVVYTSKVFRKNRRNEHGIETEEISVQTTQVVGIAKKQDEPKEKSPGEPSRHMHDAKPQTGEGLALTMATSLNIIVQEPESIVEVGEVAKQQETTESAEQQKQLEDIKPVENASSTQESNTIDAGEPSKARSKVISDVKDAHATKSTELVVNDLVAGLIASTQELKIQDEPKNKSTEHIVEIEMSKAGVITV